MIDDYAKFVNNEKCASDLFSHLRRGGGWSFTQGITGKKRVSAWIPAGAPFAYPKRWNGQLNIYWGVNPTSTPVTDDDRKNYAGWTDARIMPKVGSKNATISAVNTFIADLDGKDYTDPNDDEIAAAYAIVKAEEEAGYPKRLAEKPTARPLPESSLYNKAVNLAQDTKYKTDPDKYKALALAHANAFTMRPSVLIESGGGYQAYWLLDEPFVIQTEDDRTHIKDLYRRWNDYTGGDPAVNDLRRILRVPGTMNVKPKYAPNYPTAEFVWCDLGLTYTLDQIKAVLPEVTEENTTDAQHRQPTHRHPRAKVHRTAALPTQQLSKFAVRVAMAYNANHTIGDELRAVGYTDAGHNRMSRPGDDNSKGIQINPHKNGSYHHSSNDPLFGAHLQRPFDVRRVYDFGGDPEIAANELAPEVGMMSHADFLGYIAGALAIVAGDNDGWADVVTDEGRGGNNNRRLMMALILQAKKLGKLVFTLSCRHLAAAANSDQQTTALVSVKTAHAFVKRMNGTWFDAELVTDEKGVNLYRFTLRTIVGKGNTPVCHTEDNRGVTFTNDGITAHFADDAFASGTSREVREQVRSQTEGGDYKALLAARLPGLGMYGLMVLCYLLRNPDSTRREIAEGLGLKPWSVANALRKLEAWALVDAEQVEGSRAKSYVAADNVWELVKTLTPAARTYQIGAERYERQIAHCQRQAEREIQKTTDENRIRASVDRAERMKRHRAAALMVLHPDWTTKEIWQHINAPCSTRRPWVDRKIAERQAAERQAERAAESAAMMAAIDDLRRQGIKGSQAYHYAELAGWTASESAKIAAIASGKQLAW